MSSWFGLLTPTIRLPAGTLFAPRRSRAPSRATSSLRASVHPSSSPTQGLNITALVAGSLNSVASRRHEWKRSYWLMDQEPVTLVDGSGTMLKCDRQSNDLCSTDRKLCPEIAFRGSARSFAIPWSSSLCCPFRLVVSQLGFLAPGPWLESKVQ